MSSAEGGESAAAEDALERCLELMKGSSDESKLAGLLLFTKWLNTPEGTERQGAGLQSDLRRRVLESVTPQFLGRLLHTRTGAEGTGPSAFQSVAVSVLACLAQDERLTLDLVNLAEGVLSIFDVAEDPKLVEDCLYTIYMFAKAQSAEATKVLARNHALDHVLSHLDRARRQSEADTALRDQACTVLRELESLEDVEGGVWVTDAKGLAALAAMLDDDKTQLKLALVHVMASLLARRRGRAEEWYHGDVLAEFGVRIRSALVQLLHGGLQESHRDAALSCLVHMMGIFGQGWAVEERGTAQNGVVLEVGTSADFFVHTLSVETRLASEELEGLWGLAGETEEGGAEIRRRIDRAVNVLPLCVDGLESALRFLCDAGGGEVPLPEPPVKWSELPGPTLLRLRTSLHHAVKSLLKFVKEASSDGFPPGLRDVTFDALRLLSAVVTEDEAAFTPAEAVEVVPIVVRAVQEGLGAATGSGSDKVLRWVLPWVSRALSTEDTSPIEGLVDQNTHLLLLDQLKEVTTSDADEGNEQVAIDAMMVLHELLMRGGTLACVTHQCLLSRHPKALALLPHIARGISTTQRSARFRRHAAWFAAELMVGASVADIGAVLPARSKEQDALFKAIAKAARGPKGVEEEEEAKEAKQVAEWTAEALGAAPKEISAAIGELLRAGGDEDAVLSGGLSKLKV